jgi:hypothetical protein
VDFSQAVESDDDELLLPIRVVLVLPRGPSRVVKRYSATGTRGRHCQRHKPCACQTGPAGPRCTAVGPCPPPRPWGSPHWHAFEQECGQPNREKGGRGAIRTPLAHARGVRILLHGDGGSNDGGDLALAGDDVQGQGQADAEHALEPGPQPVHDGVVGRQLVVAGAPGMGWGEQR